MVSCIISFLRWLQEQADWKAFGCIKSPYEFCFSANVNQFQGTSVCAPSLSLSMWQVACQNECLVSSYRIGKCVHVCKA